MAKNQDLADRLPSLGSLNWRWKKRQVAMIMATYLIVVVVLGVRLRVVRMTAMAVPMRVFTTVVVMLVLVVPMVRATLGVRTSNVNAKSTRENKA